MGSAKIYTNYYNKLEVLYDESGISFPLIYLTYFDCIKKEYVEVECYSKEREDIDRLKARFLELLADPNTCEQILTLYNIEE